MAVKKRYFIHESYLEHFADLNCWVTGEKLERPSPTIRSHLFELVHDSINRQVQKENPAYRVSGGALTGFDHEYRMALRSWKVLPERHEREWMFIEFIFDWYTFPILTENFWTDVGGVG